MDALQRGNLLDAGGLYVTGEDNLRLTTFGGVANLVVVMEGRLLDCDGRIVPLAERHVPNSNYTAAQSIFGLAEGVLTNVQLRIATGTAGRGGVFGVLEIVRGVTSNAQALGTLLQGYITTNARLAWPGSPIESSLNGPGRLRSITGTDPAAGAEISETVPTGVRWKLVSFTAILATSAVVANRAPSLILDDGATTVFQLGANGTVAASSAAGYTWAAGLGIFGSTGNGNAGALPDPAWLSAGYRIRTQTGLFDVGDNWGAPRYLVEEWIE
jgi:hypothetical protein